MILFVSLVVVVFIIAHCHNVHNIAPHGATAAEQSDSARKEACFQGFGPPSRNSNSVIFGSIHNQSINQSVKCGWKHRHVNSAND